MVGQTALGNPSRRGDVHRAAAAQGIKEEEGGRQAVVHARRIYMPLPDLASCLSLDNLLWGLRNPFAMVGYKYSMSSLGFTQSRSTFYDVFGATPKERKARWRRNLAVGDFEHILRDVHLHLKFTTQCPSLDVTLFVSCKMLLVTKTDCLISLWSHWIWAVNVADFPIQDRT